MQNSNTNPERINQRQILWFEIGVFLLLIGIGIGSRFWLIDAPNFKPIAAIALFAGFFFRRLWVALGGVCLVMLVSDGQLGHYHWQVNLTVYAAMLVSVLLGCWIARRPQSNSTAEPIRSVGLATVMKFIAASLTMSTLFFLLTNLAVWQFTGWYPTTWHGLGECFVAAIPFYRWTLVGDLFFTTVIVGVYAFACLLIRQTWKQPIVSQRLDS